MKTTNFTVRVTKKEQREIRQKYADQNVSEIIRNFLLENQAEPRQVRKA